MAKPHEILGVAPEASLSQIKAAYRRLAQQHHPDRTGGDTEEFQRIKAAYETLVATYKSFGPFDQIFTDTARELRK